MARFSGYNSPELGRAFPRGPGYDQPNCGFDARLQHRLGTGIERPPVVNTSLPVRRVGCQPGCLDVWQKRHEQTPSRREDSVVRPGPCPHQQDGSLRQSGPPHRKEQGSALADQTWRSRCRCIAKGSASAGTTRQALLSKHSRFPPAAPQTTLPVARSARISARGLLPPPHLPKPLDLGRSQRSRSSPGRPGRATAASGRASAPPESGRKFNKRFSARKKRGRPRPDEGAPRSLRPSCRPRFPGWIRFRPAGRDLLPLPF
jgi:hypothetical protein